MLQLRGDTMGKSLGNAVRLHEVIANVGRDALIMLFVGAHYRQPMAFDDERLAEAGARVARIRDAARRLVAGESPATSRRAASRTRATRAPASARRSSSKAIGWR